MEHSRSNKRKIKIAYEAQATTDPLLSMALVQVFFEKIQTSAMLSSRHALNNVVLVTWHLLTRQQQLILCLNKQVLEFSNKRKIRNHSRITTMKIRHGGRHSTFANSLRPLQFPGR